MAYGVSWEPILNENENEDGTCNNENDDSTGSSTLAYTMTLVALPKRKGIFKLVNGRPRAIMEINGYFH
eukprot:scaffold658_cov91-Cylindrotheca_fusiformis.AAC.4